MFGLSFTEIAIVAVLALLLLGPDQLPGMTKSIGKTLRDLRRTGDDLRRTFETEMVKMEDQINAEPVKAVKKAAPPVTAATPQATLGTYAGPGPEAPDALSPLPEDVPPWMNLPDRPTPPRQAVAEDTLPLDQRSAHQTIAKRDGLRVEGEEDLAPSGAAAQTPEALAQDPASQRARVRRGSLPIAPSAARAQVRKQAAALAAPPAATPSAATPPAAIPPAAIPPAAAPVASALASLAAPAEDAPVRAAPPMTVPREKKRGPVA